ncbi:uncharacterized protein At1g76660 isoform X2 [Phalaenopsis equestris]|uniref:uncharacterized protein At1g76660 isoform X2 n=1 Tax=Phalaenopsis equestris TaxID=78828 RepID=UPI0009E466C3|nr:uncharacterized protein At1g76660 isoform X2 [Phalaenopsis equestris]
MAGNGRGGSNTGGGASISVAAVAVGSVEARFPPPERRSRWGGCFGGFSCFGSQKGGKRIVPATRIPDGNGSTSRGNMPQSAGPSNQNTNLNLSLLAPPSSPASFTNSALPSTVQSPSCFLSLSANSPGGPSSTMFTTGPYAHETQLVSPPVFSTYTTEPSTAPLTPPPELAHLTTPSSPDVPFAQLLSSSLKLRSSGKVNGVSYSGYVGGDFQSNYPLYPGSPTSSLISPASGTPRTGLSSPYPEGDTPTRWSASIVPRDLPHSRNGPSKLFGLDSATSRNFMLPSDSSFFRPDNSAAAQFYLDQAQQSFSSYAHCGARLSVSREGDVYSGGGNRPNKSVKQDPEEIEAYRASFGFSADEIVATPNYVEINDGVDVSFTMSSPFSNCKSCIEHHPFLRMPTGGQKSVMVDSASQNMPNHVFRGDIIVAANYDNPIAGGANNSCHDTNLHPTEKKSEATFSKSTSRRTRVLESCSDAEIEYRRARSVKDANNALLASFNSPS